MTHNKKEDVGLTKPNYVPTVRKTTGGKQKTKPYRSDKRHLSNVSKNPSRFKKAFRKALYHRSQYLGRKLSRSEWIQLKSAVLKQVTARTDFQSVQLRRLAEEVALLKQRSPADLSAAQDSIAMLNLQLNMLRQAVMATIDEKTSVTETCSHFRNRTIYVPPSYPAPMRASLPELGSINADVTYHPQSKPEQLCCSRCLREREDCYFSWTGTDLSFSSFSIDHYFPTTPIGETTLRHVSPLSIQSIWTQIVSLKIRARATFDG